MEFKAGVDSDSTFLHEDFHYAITDPDQFDEDTPQSLTFAARGRTWSSRHLSKT